jgi:hypothetical protein
MHETCITHAKNDLHVLKHSWNMSRKITCSKTCLERNICFKQFLKHVEKDLDALKYVRAFKSFACV